MEVAVVDLCCDFDFWFDDVDDTMKNFHLETDLSFFVRSATDFCWCPLAVHCYSIDDVVVVVVAFSFHGYY